MAVQTESSRVQYVGNASTSVGYSVPFYFFGNEDLVVVITNDDNEDTTLVLDTDYTVTGAGDEDGGSVLTIEAVPTSSRVTIYREISATQTTEYESNDAFPAASHERALDRLTMLVQQALRQTGGAVRFAESGGEQPALPYTPLAIMGTDSDSLVTLRTVEEMRAFLELEGGSLFDHPTTTWADDGERAVKVADFTGQLGVQLDSGEVYRSTSTTAGAWTSVTQIVPDGSITAAKLATDAVTTIKITDANVTAAKLAADAVTTAKVQDAAVTPAKLGAGVSLPIRGSYSKLRVKPKASEPNTTVEITCDEIVLKTALGGDAKLFASVAVQANIDSSGEGGRMAGVDKTDDTWYYVWLIGKADGTVAAILNTSATSVSSLPSGYLYSALVSCLRRTGVGWRGFIQADNKVALANSTIFEDRAGFGSSYTALTSTDLTTFQAAVAPIATYASGSFGFRDSADGEMWIASVTASIGTGIGEVHVRCDIGGADADDFFVPWRVPMGTSVNVSMKSTTVGSDYCLYVTGYEL